MAITRTQSQLNGSVKEPNIFHNYETEKITRKASDAAENQKTLQLYSYYNYLHNLQLTGSVKEPNILIYFFFCPSLTGVLFQLFCLLVEGERQILVF